MRGYREDMVMQSTERVTPGQKWRVNRPFRVERGGSRFLIPQGSTLVVTMVRQDYDAVWVSYGYNRFQISQQNMADYATPA